MAIDLYWEDFKVGDTVIQEWTAKAGDEGKRILDAYRASR